MAQLRPFGPSVPRALRLLLLAALLIGVVTMHTLGHPAGGHGERGGHGGYGGHGGREAGDGRVAARQALGHHAMAPEPVRAPAARLVTGGPGLDADPGSGPASAAASRAASAFADPSAPGGMDPMTVCLAVLAGWTLVLLIAGPLLRSGGDAAAEVRARLLRAVRAQPPPGGGRILLARLSVLRQ
ncbi:hypothetical protein ACIRST_05625 [Kitasatospora sp. NPDC101447]|uniref:hypothetical protein n=1 Tax=Kitasatospora sp. NPDC101447 TaxID=3364102 RepID=UPI0037FC06C4